VITIGLSSHHVESLPHIREQMERHQRILLEDVPSPHFAAMLGGDISIGDYLAGLESGFPEFERRLYNHLRELHRAGRKIVQVEPFLEKLVFIHGLFETGKTPDDVLGDAGLREVYLAEKSATGALITYYARSQQAPFKEVVEAVKAFACTDAHRLILRDRLRARAIAAFIRPGEKTYVEAGYIHQPLCRFLRRELNGKEKIHVVYPLGPSFASLGERRSRLGPGDRLTLHYAGNKKPSGDLLDLLAARSLIYIKLVNKEELLPGKASHIEDEARANRFVEALQIHHCRELFEQIRNEPPESALEAVQAYLRAARALQSL
jgi:hypothetical protein